VIVVLRRWVEKYINCDVIERRNWASVYCCILILILIGHMCVESADFRKERVMGRGDVGTIMSRE
jgi:hypothetical protein